MEELGARDEGTGRPILILHGGMGDASSWKQVTDHLHDRYRTVRAHRRQYRLDVPRKVTVADEVAETTALARSLTSPPGEAQPKPVLIGHSSGAVLALETLVADPGLFGAAVLYEPPLILDSDPHRTAEARAALAAGKVGKAWYLFVHDIAGLRSPFITAARFVIGMQGEKMAPIVERQLDDHDALESLGNRLDAYRAIDVPVLLIAGDRSPHYLIESLDSLEKALPRATRVKLPGQGHNAERTGPAQLATAIAGFLG